jgi:hypothetical protein
MVAIGVGLINPQFADHAVIRQRLVHVWSPKVHVALPDRVPAAVPQVCCQRIALAPFIYGALQQ